MGVVHKIALRRSTASRLVSLLPFALHVDACVLEARALNYEHLIQDAL